MVASRPRPVAWLMGFVAWAVLAGLLFAEHRAAQRRVPAVKAFTATTTRARVRFVLQVPEKPRRPDPSRVPDVGYRWLEEPVHVVVQPGRQLVAAGTKVKPFHHRLLVSARRAAPPPTFGDLALRLALALALLALLVWAGGMLAGSLRRLSVLLFAVSLSVTLALVIKLYTPLPLACAPLALAPLWVGLTAGRWAGLLAAAAAGALAALVALAPPPTLLGLGVGLLIAALSTWRRRTGSLLLAGALAGGAQLGVVHLVAPVLPAVGGELEGALVYGGVGPWAAGLAAWVLAWPVLRWAQVASAGQLRRLAAPRHPLVRELRRRARGTHAHAGNVARLAQAAQRAVGGDRLLLRAGAWYHDLGKLIGSDHFAENRRPGEPDPHAELSCEASARRIARHVPDGLRLARRYRLPAELRTLIACHHGTGSVHGPLERARREGRDIDPAVYYYPGPLPDSTEGAVLLVCDAVEAASRRLDDASLAAASRVVEEVVDRLMSEYQFERCDLTQRELVRLSEALIAALRHGLRRRPELDNAPADDNEQESP